MPRLRVTKDLTQKEVREIFYYDPNDGIFRWKISPNSLHKNNIGKTVGGKVEPCGIRITYKGVKYLAHRLAWIYTHGEIEKSTAIIHKDGNLSNNKISNLKKRLYTNVYQVNRIGTKNWAFGIRIEGKEIRKCFTTKEKAEAYAREFKELLS